MNPAFILGSLRIVGFACLVAAAAIAFGTAAAFGAAGGLLILQTIPPRQRGKAE